MGDYDGDRVAFEVAEALALCAGADEAGVAEDVLHGAVNLVVEIGLDLEYLPELLIVSGQQEVRHGVTGNDELDLEGDRLGPQALRCEEAELLDGVLEANFLGANHALKAFPGARLHHDVHEIEDEVAAVREVHRPWLEHGVVADIGTQIRPPFDAAEEVRPAGVRLDDDGRAGGVRVVHEDVAAKGAEGVGLARRASDWVHRGRCDGCCLFGLRAQRISRSQGELFELFQEVDYLRILIEPL